MTLTKHPIPKKKISLFTQVPFSRELAANGLDQKKFSNLVTEIQEEEKTKIGHELHDNVNPLLAVALLYLDTIKFKSKKDQHTKRQIKAIINSAIQNIRVISAHLAISKKSQFSLVEQIADLIDIINQSGRFSIDFSHCPASKFAQIDQPQSIALLRIVQEQLNNIIKYSRAKNVGIKLLCGEGKIRLSIHDDGVGFDTRKASKGIGLLNIASRCREFHGSTKITSSIGNGCQLDIEMPL